MLPVLDFYLVLGPTALVEAIPALSLRSLTDRNHLNAPSIGGHHTLAEEGALVVTGRDSVPVAISFVAVSSISVACPISVAAPVSVAASVSVAAHKPAVSTIEATAPEILSLSQVCFGYSEGG